MLFVVHPDSLEFPERREGQADRDILGGNWLRGHNPDVAELPLSRHRECLSDAVKRDEPTVVPK
ncbi:hypothetical protein GCM10009000_066430 [Halobacterium noricense]|uniref:Uncharacterized protein n=1 Tax=Haladaptatus pallidirubidus TaxID=1008152 RepID=A0AAV3UH10_9EURY|nr:hypothetical protein [Haladaptatus pallidirubidus]